VFLLFNGFLQGIPLNRAGMPYNAARGTRLKLFEGGTMPTLPDIYLNNVRLCVGRFRLSALFVARPGGVQVTVSNPYHSLLS
jgi:hypothetical protein